MPLETGTYIPDLLPSNPPDTDAEAQGAAHLRLVKGTLKNTFPNFTDTALVSTQAQLDGIAQAYFAGLLSNIDVKLANGTVGAPSLAFMDDATSGLYSSAAGNIDISIAGVLVAAFNSTGLGITGAFAVSGNATVGGTLTVTGTLVASNNHTVGGTLGVTGATTLSSLSTSGNASVGGTLTVTGDATFQGTDGIVIPVGTTANRPASPTAGLSRLNATTGQAEIWNGTAWVQIGPTPFPTTQRLTSGTAYTPAVGLAWVRVRMCAGGAGGNTFGAVGTSGGNTSFGAWTCIGGANSTSWGNGQGAGAGGTGGANGTGTLIDRVAGGIGGLAGANMGGTGGANPFGGAGHAGGDNGQAGGAASPNTGAGGGGQGGSGGGTGAPAGGAGEYVEFYMTAAQLAAIGATIPIAIGAAGSAGGANAGAGAAGKILVEEFYQ